MTAKKSTKNPQKQGRILEGWGKNFSGWPEYIPLGTNKQIYEFMISCVQTVLSHTGELIIFPFKWLHPIATGCHIRLVAPKIDIDIQGPVSRKESDYLKIDHIFSSVHINMT